MLNCIDLRTFINCISIHKELWDPRRELFDEDESTEYLIELAKDESDAEGDNDERSIVNE